MVVRRVDDKKMIAKNGSTEPAAGAQTITQAQTLKAMRPLLLFAFTTAVLIIGLSLITQNQASLPGPDKLAVPVSNEISTPISVQSEKSGEPVVSAKVGVAKKAPVAEPQAAVKDVAANPDTLRAKSSSSPAQVSAAGKPAKPGLQSSANSSGASNPTPTGPSSPELNKLVIDAINK